MDGWDVGLLAAAVYMAATALIRLMIHRRDQLTEEFRRKMAKEKRRKESEPQQRAVRA